MASPIRPVPCTAQLWSARRVRAQATIMDYADSFGLIGVVLIAAVAARTLTPRCGTDRAPGGGVGARGRSRFRRVWPVMSGGHGGQLDEGIVTQRCHGFQGHVASALDRPLIMLFQ